MIKAASIPVFVGPSLPSAMRPAGASFQWRAPASAGDLAALLQAPPARLCLLDGFFDSRPAPWHKELLLLMARGTTVFGGASMGALRAAELHPFGMIGVGAIFRAYRSGRLTGDDEVALIHATERLDWAPLTVPFVEFRATLLAACRARLISPDVARRLRATVRNIYFADRDWPVIAEACRTADLVSTDIIGRLPAMHVQLKRQDALACLAAARSPLPERRACPVPPMTCFISELLSAHGP
jgi:hypothetical protein